MPAAALEETLFLIAPVAAAALCRLARVIIGSINNVIILECYYIIEVP